MSIFGNYALPATDSFILTWTGELERILGLAYYFPVISKRFLA